MAGGESGVRVEGSECCHLSMAWSVITVFKIRMNALRLARWTAARCLATASQ